MELIEICQLGNPILRQVAAPVVNITDLDIQKLIDQMLEQTYKSEGMGLAAPQIGRSLQILVIASHPNARYPFAPNMEPTVLINPQILNHSQTKAKGWEGCLSVPGLRAMIARFESVEVGYGDRYGIAQTAIFTDFIARIFLHEYDHLQGASFFGSP